MNDAQREPDYEDPRVREDLAERLAVVYLTADAELSMEDGRTSAGGFVDVAVKWIRGDGRFTYQGRLFLDALAALMSDADGTLGVVNHAAEQYVKRGQPAGLQDSVESLRLAVGSFEEEAAAAESPTADAIVAFGTQALAVLEPRVAAGHQADAELAADVRRAFRIMVRHFDVLDTRLRQGDPDGWVPRFLWRLTNELKAAGPEGEAALDNLSKVFAGDDPGATPETRLIDRVLRGLREGRVETMDVVSPPPALSESNLYEAVQHGSSRYGGDRFLGENLLARMGRSPEDVEQLIRATGEVYEAFEHTSLEARRVELYERKAQDRVMAVLADVWARDAEPHLRPSVVIDAAKPFTQRLDAPVPSLEAASGDELSMIAVLNGDIELTRGLIGNEQGPRRLERATELVYRWVRSVEAADTWVSRLPAYTTGYLKNRAKETREALQALATYEPATASEETRNAMSTAIHRATYFSYEVGNTQNSARDLVRISGELGLVDPAQAAAAYESAELSLAAVPHESWGRGDVLFAFPERSIGRVVRDGVEAGPKAAWGAVSSVRLANLMNTIAVSRNSGRTQGPWAEFCTLMIAEAARVGGPKGQEPHGASLIALLGHQDLGRTTSPADVAADQDRPGRGVGSPETGRLQGRTSGGTADGQTMA